MSKKLLALLLALVMIVGSFTSVLADTAKTEDKKETVTEEKKDEKSEEKKDEKSEEKTEEKTEEKKEEEPVKTNNKALDDAIAVLKKAGIITGYSADSDDFKVEKNVKRSEFATMIVKAMGLEASAKALATIPTGFKDVPTNHWANGYIAVAKQQGFVNGYTDGTFRPDRQISYQDMATMLTIALGQAEVGTVYPAGYIVKAQQLGLFNNVDTPSYKDMATRGNVFIMLHNMINCKEFGKRKIVKAIVLENSRVEKMADNEIVVEVIKVVQEANWVEGSRTKRGDQHKYVLDKDLKLDAEDLLGKVIDLTTNKDDQIVDVKVDTTYDYVDGKITNVDAKKFGVERKNYSALFDERYDNDDERIYRTYLNRKDLKYIDFARNYEYGAYDFARATIKNGKVVFIDAYKFDDIAPVSNAKDGDVYYLDDAWKANEVKASKLNSRVVFHDKAGYSVGDIKNIAKDDVIHFYNGYTDAIVRKDAKFEGKLDKTVTRYENNRTDYVVLGEDEYELAKKEPFQAIYSFEGKKYFVVTGGNRRILDDIVKDNVKVLVALDGTAQLIEGTKEWSDGIQAIKRITSKGEIKFLPSAGEEFWASEGRDTEYYVANMLDVSNNARLHNFAEDDIVFLARGEKEEIAVMGNILPKSEYYGLNGINMHKKAGINGRYIWYEDKNDAMVYKRHFSNLHAYGYGKYGLYQIKDLGEFIKKNAKNNKLEAYVLTETELKDRLWDRFEKNSFNFLSSKANDVASIVVFKGAVDPQDTEPLYAEILRIWNDSVEYIDADKNMFSTNGKELPAGAVIGDIVELNVTKATLKEAVKKVVGKAEFAIRLADDIYEIRESMYKPQTYEILVNGVWKEVKWDGDQVVFNPREHKYVQFRTAIDEKSHEEFMDVMRYIDQRRARVNYNGYINVPGTSYNWFAYEDLAMRPAKARIEGFTQLIHNNRVLATGGKDIYDTLHDKAANFDGTKVRLEYNNAGELVAIYAIETKGDIAIKDDQDLLNSAVKAIKDKFNKDYPNGKIELKSTDQEDKALDDFETLAKKELMAKGFKKHSTWKADKGDTIKMNAKSQDKAKKTVTLVIETMTGRKAEITVPYHQSTLKEENEATAKKIVEELGSRPFVEVDLSETPIGDKVETAIKAAIKKAATAKGVTLQDADITVKYAEKDYTATITVGTGNDAYTTPAIPFEVKSKTN